MSVEIPKIRIPARGDVFEPTAANLDGGINQALEERGQFALCAGNHELVALPSTLPHYPWQLNSQNGEEVHMTYWVNKGASKKINGWTVESWQGLAQDGVFLQAVENRFRKRREMGLDTRVYFLIGFVNPADVINDDLVFSRGLQTQHRPHLHEVKPIDLTTPFSEKMNARNGIDFRKLKFFLNLAGERCIGQFQNDLEDFGERFIYKQQLNRDGKRILSRTMFGFDTLQEAISKSLQLQERVWDRWLPYVRSIALEYEKPKGKEADLIIKQSQIPNMAIIIPSYKDIQNGQVESDKNIWVMPFAVCSPQEILTPGGVILDRV